MVREENMGQELHKYHLRLRKEEQAKYELHGREERRFAL